MMEDALDLNDLVVRVLGMKRKKKALGYSVQEIDDDELNETKEFNILNSLSGKAVGINLIQGGGLMMLSLMI